MRGISTIPTATTAHWTAGKVGGALRFDGPTTLQHVIVPNFPKSTTGYTISAWVQADAVPTVGQHGEKLVR